jgi:uncharacterized membrane protein YhhN
LKNILYPRFTIFYAMLCILVMLFEQMELEWSYYLTKPVPLLMIIIFFRLQTEVSANRKFINFMMAGFIASMAGDILLMFSNRGEQWFISGLIAFLTAHVMYMLGFVSQTLRDRPWTQHWGQLAFATLIVVYGAEFFILNRQYFGSLKIPVMVYCIAITAMGVAATMRDRDKNPGGYMRVLIGVVFFIISDSLLAANKFIEEFAGAGPAILVTYFFAQYMIATGCLVDIEKKEMVGKLIP